MMRAVHPKVFVARDIGYERTPRQLRIVNDVVLAIQPTMVDRAGYLQRNVHDQRAAQRNVHELMASANGKERLVLTKCFIHEHQLKQIAVRLGFRHSLL